LRTLKSKNRFSANFSSKASLTALFFGSSASHCRSLTTQVHSSIQPEIEHLPLSVGMEIPWETPAYFLDSEKRQIVQRNDVECKHRVDRGENDCRYKRGNEKFQSDVW
jgi:hypothetical protein